jgi:glycogen(starch) synthase
MRIAFISYEYPPDIAKGGIATYLTHISKILYNCGHDIEIFAASNYREGVFLESGVLIHRIKCNDVETFNSIVLNRFSMIHESKAFDLVECPEIHAHCLLIKEKYKKLPIVVKLHTPLFLQSRLLNFNTSFYTKVRYFLGALRRMKFTYYGKYEYKLDREFHQVRLSDSIYSPSLSLAKILSNEWHINISHINVIPNPFIPPKILLDIPIQESDTKNVFFIGKLNPHKGIVQLIAIMKKVIREKSDVHFYLIGADQLYAAKRMIMSEFIETTMRGYEKNYSLLGALEYEDLLKYYDKMDVCVFPSLWENFPYVCLEAMSAGKAIIGSSEGGMSEMLNSESGILLNPLQIKNWAEKILYLLENPSKRVTLGQAARKTVINKYNEKVIGALTENYFKEVINRATFSNNCV